MQGKGIHLRAVSFPVGGIGAGCIGVAGNGDLAEWEVFNRPAKGRRNGMSHFAVRAEREGGDGEIVDARVLHGDFAGALSGAGDTPFAGFGFGPAADSLCGLPHFRSVTLRGEFPVGEWSFRDPNFPGDAALVAWSPFVPGRSDASSLPCAVFEIALRNRAREPLVFSVVGCLASPWSGAVASSRVLRRAGRAVLLHSNATAPDSPDFGELALTLDADADAPWARPYLPKQRRSSCKVGTFPRNVRASDAPAGDPTGGTPVEVSRQTAARGATSARSTGTTVARPARSETAATPVPANAATRDCLPRASASRPASRAPCASSSRGSSRTARTTGRRPTASRRR